MSFTGVLTASDNFSGRSSIRFGIGETIQLSYTASPSGTTAAFLALHPRYACVSRAAKRKKAGPLKRNRPDKSHRENAQDFFFFVTLMSMPGAICCNCASPSLAC